MLKRLIFVFSALLALTLIQASDARAEEGHHSLGVQAGQVGLLGDVGSAYGNALGMGAFFNYAASDFLEFDLDWISSRHSNNNLNLTQNSFAVTLQYDVDTFDIFTPYIKGGAEFATHTQDIAVPGQPTTSYSSTGFGLPVGLGCKVDVTPNFMAGLDFTYHNMFDTSVTPTGSSTAVKTIQSFYTVMLRAGYAFGGKK